MQYNVNNAKGIIICDTPNGSYFFVSLLQSRCSMTGATPPVHFLFSLFWRWRSCELFAQAGLELHSF
jgi:hypothetical protein